MIVHLRVGEVALLLAARDQLLELRLAFLGHYGQAALDTGELAARGMRGSAALRRYRRPCPRLGAARCRGGRCFRGSGGAPLPFGAGFSATIGAPFLGAAAGTDFAATGALRVGFAAGRASWARACCGSAVACGRKRGSACAASSRSWCSGASLGFFGRRVLQVGDSWAAGREESGGGQRETSDSNGTVRQWLDSVGWAARGAPQPLRAQRPPRHRAWHQPGAP